MGHGMIWGIMAIISRSRINRPMFTYGSSWVARENAVDNAATVP